MSSQPPGAPRPRHPAAAAAEQALRALFHRRASAPSPVEASGASPGPQAAGAATGPSWAPAPPPAHPPLDLPGLLALARTADYFEVLGVARSASGGEIRDAATRLLSELDLAKLTAGSGDGASDLQEVRQVVLDARDVLADDALRAEYLRAVEDVAGSPSS